jgi:hypothetical protein
VRRIATSLAAVAVVLHEVFDASARSRQFRIVGAITEEALRQFDTKTSLPLWLPVSIVSTTPSPTPLPAG